MEKQICNCIHGAAQIQVNPQVRKALGMSEEIEKVSFAEQLRQTKARITKETWIKGFYFGTARPWRSASTAERADDAAATATDRRRADAAGAHARGAAAAATTAAAATKAAVTAAARGAEAEIPVDATEEAINNGNKLLRVWQGRISLYRNYDYHNYGTVQLHFLMGMFGLTAEFNDDKDTTLEMIHDRFDKAIAFAEEHAEFLANN